jgi:hypothetical protein
MSKFLFYGFLLCLVFIGVISSSEIHPKFWSFIRENNWIPNLIVTVILAVITYVYASDTRKMMKISTENLRIETEPNVIISDEVFGAPQIINVSKYPIYVTISKLNHITNPQLNPINLLLVPELSHNHIENIDNVKNLIEPGQSRYIYYDSSKIRRIETLEEIEIFIEYMYTSTGSKKYTKTKTIQKFSDGHFHITSEELS